MACTCSPTWRSQNWTMNGPTPHEQGCGDGEYHGTDYNGLLDLARRELEPHQCIGCRKVLAGYSRADGRPMCQSCVFARESQLSRLTKDATSPGFPRLGIKDDNPSGIAYHRVRKAFPDGGDEARDAFWRFLREEEEKASAARPAREDYVRATADFGGFTYEPALEFRAGDDFDQLAKSLKGVACNVSLTGSYHERRCRDAMDNARMVADVLAREWPDRAYFVEVWQEGREGFAQVFQPFGVPRNR